MGVLRSRSGRAVAGGLIALAAGVAAAPAAAQNGPVPCRSAEALYRGKLLAPAAEAFRALEASTNPPDCLHTAQEVEARRTAAADLVKAAQKSDAAGDLAAARVAYQKAAAIDASNEEARAGLLRLADAQSRAEETGDDIEAIADDGFDLLRQLLKGVLLLLTVAAVLAFLAALVVRLFKTPLRRRNWRPLRGFVATPLTVADFKGGAKGTAEAFSGALRASVPQALSQPGTAIDLVATPAGATDLLAEVTSAVSAAPQGKPAAALLKLVNAVLPRDALRLDGQLLEVDGRAAGVALLLTGPRGKALSAETLWAGDFSPTAARGGAATAKAATAESEAAPLPADAMRLALAVSVWTAYEILNFRGSDAREAGTTEWRSHALSVVGVRSRALSDAQLRELFARACDADPDNLAAATNLASLTLDVAASNPASPSPDTGGHRAAHDLLEALWARLCGALTQMAAVRVAVAAVQRDVQLARAVREALEAAPDDAASARVVRAAIGRDGAGELAGRIRAIMDADGDDGAVLDRVRAAAEAVARHAGLAAALASPARERAKLRAVHAETSTLEAAAPGPAGAGLVRRIASLSDTSRGDSAAGRLEEEMRYRVAAYRALLALEAANDPAISLPGNAASRRGEVLHALSWNLADLLGRIDDLQGSGRPRDRETRRRLLTLEGPLLAIWANVRLLEHPGEEAGSTPRERWEVAARLTTQELRHPDAVAWLTGRAPLDAYTAYNIACYHAASQRGNGVPEAHRAAAYRWLEAALASGGLAAGAGSDRSFTALRSGRGAAGWKRLMAPYTPQPSPWELAMIGPARAAPLQTQVIEDPDALLALARTEPDRKLLAKALEVEAESVLRWARLLELQRRIACDFEALEALDRVGVRSIGELAASDADTLSRRLRRTAGDGRPDRDALRPAVVRQWVADAGDGTPEEVSPPSVVPATPRASLLGRVWAWLRRSPG